ncbi:MAG TPA: hypothetical protein VGM10_08150 [Actinocrinis sp.]|jgi:hypothetical protein
MKGKAGFVGGTLVGLLVGSRIGRGLYDRVSGGAAALAKNPTLRRSAGTAGGKAAEAAKSLGAGAAGQAKQAGSTLSHKLGDRRHGGGEQAAAGSPSSEDDEDGFGGGDPAAAHGTATFRGAADASAAPTRHFHFRAHSRSSRNGYTSNGDAPE